MANDADIIGIQSRSDFLVLAKAVLLNWRCDERDRGVENRRGIQTLCSPTTPLDLPEVASIPLSSPLSSPFDAKYRAIVTTNVLSDDSYRFVIELVIEGRVWNNDGNDNDDENDEYRAVIDMDGYVDFSHVFASQTNDTNSNNDNNNNNNSTTTNTKSPPPQKYN